jgi:hypothetical protein
MNADDCFALFSLLTDMAEEHRDHGDVRTAVSLAQIAARLAYPANARLFASPRLERLLIVIGKSLPTPRTSPPPKSMSDRRTAGDERRVLHVLSYARPVGGDTRYVWRWIEADSTSRHSVAVTTQADVEDLHPVPTALTAAIARSRGRLHLLDSPASNPLAQALELRAIVQTVDVVVLHIFPYDVVPVLALAAGCDASKTVFVNHSDHTFWLGAGVSHRVLHLRDQPTRALQDRHLPVRDDPLLPIPLEIPSPATAKAAARASMACREDTLVLLTIASPFKFTSPGRLGLLDLLLPVLIEMEHVVLIAVGPPPEGAWAAAGALTQGRVRALGMCCDTAPLYAMADVYLDSIPFSSITSILEAGSHGLPLLGLQASEPDLVLLGPGAPGLRDAMDMASNHDDYRRRLRLLIGDRTHRLRAGDQARARILAHHCGEGWRSAVNAVYLSLESASARGCSIEQPDSFVPASLSSALTQLYGHANRRQLRRLLWKFLGPLPYSTRARAVWRLYRTGFELSVSNLMPSWVNRMARSLVRRAVSASVLLKGDALRRQPVTTGLRASPSSNHHPPTP